MRLAALEGALGALDALVMGVLERLSDASLSALGLALGFHVLKLAARARSWTSVLRAAYPHGGVRYGDALGAYLGGVAANAVVPARAGDALRLWLARRRIEGSSYPSLAATYVPAAAGDAIAGASTLAVLLAITTVSPGPPAVPIAPASALATSHAIAIVGACLALAVLAALAAWRARARLAPLLERFRCGCAILGDPRAYARGVLTWLLAAWAARIASVFWFLAAFHVTASLKAALVVIGVQGLANLVPLVPGGAGAQQAALLVAFSGSTTTAAILGFGIGMQAAAVVVDVALGLAALGLMTRTAHWRRQLLAAAADVEVLG